MGGLGDCEMPPVCAFRGNGGELADCVCGVLFPGSREPHRLWRIQRISIKDYPRGNYAVRLRCIRMALFRRRDHLELRDGFSVFGGRRGVCFLGKIVSAAAMAFPHASNTKR